MRRGAPRISTGRLRAVLAALLAAAAAAAAATPALAGSGPLDPSFGEAGVVLPGEAVPGFHGTRGLAIASNADVLVAAATGSGQALTVARYLPNGALDSGFAGGAGFVAVPGVSFSGNRVAAANDLAVDDRGRPIVLWHSRLIRLTSDGAIDPTFGDAGTAQPRLAEPRLVADNVRLRELAVQPDGRVLATGPAGGPSPSMVVVRLLPDGSLDPSFGTGGVAELRFGERAWAFALALLPDGRILLAGDTRTTPALIRLLPDGRPDPSFGRKGRAHAPPGVRGMTTSVAIQGDGKVLLAGNGWMLRYTRGGRPDRSFGRAGVRLTTQKHGQAVPIAILPLRRHIVVLTNGRGPGFRLLHPDGGWDRALAGPAFPRDRFFGTVGTLQEGKAVVAWTPKHAPEMGSIVLERLLIR